MATHFPVDQWRVWLLEFDQSELTVARFCDLIGVSVLSFYKWRKKMKVLDESAGLPTSVSNFVPVVLQTSVVEIELPGRAVARIPNDADSLRPILSVLLNLEPAQ